MGYLRQYVVVLGVHGMNTWFATLSPTSAPTSLPTSKKSIGAMLLCFLQSLVSSILYLAVC